MKTRFQKFVDLAESNGVNPRLTEGIVGKLGGWNEETEGALFQIYHGGAFARPDKFDTNDSEIFFAICREPIMEMVRSLAASLGEPYLRTISEFPYIDMSQEDAARGLYNKDKDLAKKVKRGLFRYAIERVAASFAQFKEKENET